MAGDRRLVEYEDALASVLDRARSAGSEACALQDLVGRVLAEPVCALHDMPFFDTSAMDGYAIAEADLNRLAAEGSVRLALAGTLAAGDDPTGIVLEPGFALKILTGACAPPGTAAIAMQEDAEEADGHVEIRAMLRRGANVRFRGEEFRAGDRIAPAGIAATPGVVAAMAAAGHASVMVARRPSVGLLITGEELTPPGEPLSPGRIYDANSFGVAASLRALGMDAPVVERVPDDLASTQAALRRLLSQCDVVLTSGGVSVGEFDAVKPALAQLEVETVLWGVAIKPGKPFYFGLSEAGSVRRAVFGLPGNPVAAMVTFHALVRPYLLRCLGLSGRPLIARGRLSRALGKRPGRMEFVPCHLAGAGADPVVKRGSHMLGTLIETNGLVLFPRERDALECGEEVDVMLLDGGLA